jgi:hypothetical protein
LGASRWRIFELLHHFTSLRWEEHRMKIWTFCADMEIYSSKHCTEIVYKLGNPLVIHDKLDCFFIPFNSFTMNMRILL